MKYTICLTRRIYSKALGRRLDCVDTFRTFKAGFFGIKPAEIIRNAGILSSDLADLPIYHARQAAAAIRAGIVYEAALHTPAGDLFVTFSGDNLRFGADGFFITLSA